MRIFLTTLLVIFIFSISIGQEVHDNQRISVHDPVMINQDGVFYLFCTGKGVNSTYKMIVGRSHHIEGPYLDKEQKPLRYGGGSILMTGNGDWYGVGHNGICTVAGKDYILFHGYDAHDNGRSKLLIYSINWDAAGWPSLGETVY
jgi:arabinan endo-1,5-alpha-L-arabinosidase